MEGSARTQSGPYQTQSGPQHTQSRPHQTLSAQTQSGPYQTQSIPYQTQSGPYKTQSMQYQSQSVPHQTQSRRYKTQSGPHQTQSRRYKTQSGPRQTQSGQYQSQSVQYKTQVGQASQHSHAASQHSDRNGNQITQRPSAPSILYNLITADITPQTVDFIPQKGAYSSGKMPNWQTAKAPQQTVSSLQVPAGGRSNTYHQGTFTQDNAASCVNVQSGNNEPQQALHQNSLNRPNPSPPNGIQQHALYLLQGYVSNSTWMPLQGKQPVVAQDVSVNCVPPNRQCGDAENASYQNVNRIPVNILPTLPAAATSVQHTQMSPAGTSMSTTTYSQQMTHNDSNGYIIDGFQRGILPHTTAPSRTTSSQSLQSISRVMTSNSSSGQSLAQSASQQMQQITEMATSSSHSATHPSGSQYLDGRNFEKINRPHTNTMYYMPNSKMIPGDANNENLCQTPSSKQCFLTVNNNAVNSGTRLATVQKSFSSNQHSSDAPPLDLPVQNGFSSNQHSSEAPPPDLPVQNGFSSNQHSSEAPPPYRPVQKCFSSNQHSSEAPPPDLPVQKGYYVIVSEDTSGKGFKVDDIVFLGHNADTNGISKGGLQRHSSIDVLQQEQCHQSSGKTSLQRHQQSLPQTPASSSKVKDNSNHTSPGHTGQKMIAIVKPLSQANNKDDFSEISSGQCKKTTTTDESDSVHELTSIVKPVCLEMSTEEGAADAMTNHDTGTETVPNYLHAEDVESQPSGRMQATPTSHQLVTTVVPSSQSEGETKRLDEPIADAFVLSSAPLIPWTYNKLTMLTELLHNRISNKILSHLSQNYVPFPDVASTILSMFWEATYENVLMEMDSHTNLINEMEEFCSKYVASDSIILSMTFLRSLCNLKKNCHILRHDAVHRENTYKSSWLNTNEQLDDIDKEFGFPWSLKYERDEQPTLIETENGLTENAASEVQNEGVSPTEITTLCDLDYVEKQAASARDVLNQTPIPLENATADSIDSSYSFEIHVLPPEEARTLFEKLNSEQVNTEKTEDHSEMIMNLEDDLPEMVSVKLDEVKLENKVQAPIQRLSSEQVNTEKTEDHPEMIMNVEDDLPEMVSVKLDEVKLENKVQAPIQEFCCTIRWMEVMGGSNNPSLCKCQCRREQSADGVTEKSCEEERDVQTENVMDPTLESKIKVDIGNAMGHLTSTSTWMEECENLIDLTEEDEMLHSKTNMEPKHILPSSMPSVDSNIIVRDINDFFSCSETEWSLLNSELEMHYGQSEQKQPGPTETQVNTQQKQTLNFLKDVSLDSQLTSTEKTDQDIFPSSHSLAQNNCCIPHPEENLSLKARRKHKRRAETPDSLLFLKKLKMYLDPNSLPSPEDDLTPVDQPLNGNGNIDDLEPVHSKPTTVKLALFGSSPQKRYGTVINSQKSSESHSMSSQKNVFLIGPHPPVTVSVTVGYRQKGPTELTPIGGSRVMKSPDKQGISEEPSETGPKSDSPVEQPMLEGPSETGPVFHSTVKQRIYEEWRNRFVPTKRNYRGRAVTLNRFKQTKRKSRGRVMTLKKRSFAYSRQIRPETTKAGPTVTEQLPVASEGQSPPGTVETKPPLSAQSRETFLNSLRQRVAKTCGVMPKKPADTERSKYELGNPALVPLQENNVLRFNVLPKTFNFNHGPVDPDESTEPRLDIPEPDKANGKDSKLTAKRSKGAWAPDPVKKYTPLPSPDSQVPKTSSTFQQFQKKYMKKQQPSDESFS